MAIDLRACLNAISDVVNNRPRPLREFGHFSFPIPVMQPFSRWLSLEKGLGVL
jgi:hypothetical protein